MSWAAFAQADTIRPPFEVKICSNRLATVTVLGAPNMNYDKFVIDWGDNSFPSEIYAVNGSLSKTYANNQARNISVLGKYNSGKTGAKSIKSVEIQSVSPKPIIKKVVSLDEKTTELQIENPSCIEFQILQNQSSGFLPTAGKIKNSGGVKIVLPKEKSTCFQLLSNEVCAANVTSEIACNVVFKAKTDVEANILTWEMNSEKNILIQKNGADLVTISDKNTTDFADKNIICQVENCYQIFAKYENYEAISAKKCVKNEVISCEKSTIPVYIPDAFTPNNDGINDELVLKGEAKYFISLQIFDRWGVQLVDYQDFTTKWKAENVPSGEYAYKLILKNKVGEVFEKVGTVKVLR